MRPFTVHDAAGRILRRGRCQDSTFEMQARSGETVIEGSYNGRTHWIDSGTPTLRPEIGLPETHSIAADTTWTITGVPAGTEVLTDGVVVGTTDGSDLDLSFPEAGVWRVDLRPPFPWRDATSEVTVT